MKSKIDIIIPTWDNYMYAMPCVTSLIKNAATEGLFHIYLVNNGHKDSCNWISSPYVTVLQAGENLGWEGGLKLGLQHSKAPYIVFLNDDTFIPPVSYLWLNKLVQHFKDPQVGAVGPSSNVVMGMQNIFAHIPYTVFAAKFLIGFCMMVRRSALEDAGGIDDTLPGGDDLDLSIRLRDKGYKLLVDRDVFVYHHGFKTGERVYGDSTVDGGWNSYSFKEKTDFALIRKHGFKKWVDVMQGIYEFDSYNNGKQKYWEDIEGELVRERLKGKKIYDLGCGDNKTIPEAIGIDIIKKNNVIASLGTQAKSQADIVADVSKPLPIKQADTIIARHILEHMIDPIDAVSNWKQALKKGGRLIIAVPDQSYLSSIPMNVEHVHAWTPQSMQSLLKACGLKLVEQLDAKNNVSFITVAEK